MARYIKDSRWQPRTVKEPHKLEGHGWGFFGWFCHDCIANSKREGDHLHQKNQRRIEWRDGSHDAQRLTDDD